jgi:replication factor A1
LLLFIFLNKGNAIQGSTKVRDTAHFASIITKSDNLKIKGFYTYENCNMLWTMKLLFTLSLTPRSLDLFLSHFPFHDTTLISLIPHISLPKKNDHNFLQVFFNVTLCNPLYRARFHSFCSYTYSINFIDVLWRLKAIQPIEKVLVWGQTLEDIRETSSSKYTFVIGFIFVIVINFS